MSDSKMCRDSLPCQQIKNGLSSLYKYLSTAVLATPIFVTKILCRCVTLDATPSILLNSTNEANTFLTMSNIMRFSRLSKLVSSNLNLFHHWIQWQLWTYLPAYTNAKISLNDNVKIQLPIINFYAKNIVLKLTYVQTYVLNAWKLTCKKYESVLRFLSHARSKLNSRHFKSFWGSFENLCVKFDKT